MISKQ